MPRHRRLPDYSIQVEKIVPLSFPYVALAPSQSKPDPLRAYFALRINRRTDMSDFIFLALGCGTFIVFAAYARALDRL